MGLDTRFFTISIAFLSSLLHGQTLTGADSVLRGTLECQSVTRALKAASQVIAVVTDDWSTPIAEVQLFHKEKKKWVLDDKFSDSRVAKKGMGWGIGLHRLKESQNSKFRKDNYRWDFGNKSPAGIFSIGASFGTHDEIAKSEVKKGNTYYPIVEDLHCLDDYSEPLFNHLVTDDSGPRVGNLPQVAKSSITSSEHMIEMAHPDVSRYPESGHYVGWEPYQMGFVINHNMGARETQADSDLKTPYGSCIFFHVKNPDGTGTAGCTAVSADQLKKIFAWKKSSRDVILIQLPRAQWDDIEKRCPSLPIL